MSSGISMYKILGEHEVCLDIPLKPIDLSKVSIPFSSFFEEIAPEKKGIESKKFPFSKLDPELRTILIKEFLE